MTKNLNWEQVSGVTVQFNDLKRAFCLNDNRDSITTNKSILTDLLKGIFEKSDEKIACKRIFVKSEFVFTGNVVEGSYHALKDFLAKNCATYGPTPLPPGRLTEAVHKFNLRKILPFKLDYKNVKTSVLHPSKNPEDYRLTEQVFLTENWSRKQKRTVKSYDRPVIGLRTRGIL